MASPYDQDGQEDEDMAAERELGDDAMWKVIQKNTFTRWANENLKPAKVTLVDIEKDLSDGLKLISLIECLSGKKFQKFNKRPTFRTQKFENVTLSLKFLEKDEGIKIVNIDSSDIVDAKLKLIMGLIWTLILHYSISMPTWEGEDPASGKDQTPKQRLLAWIQSKIPEKKITNFSSDWNDGTAIAALVEALCPGSIPNCNKLSPKDAIKNATLGEDAAEKHLDIPQLIKPNEMCNPAVDELSMMTYLSRFPNALAKGGGPPAADKVNPARVKAYGPGLEPTGNVVGAPARFIVETAGAGKGDVQVVVTSPRGTQEKCEVVANNDRIVSYSCVYAPTMEGQYKVTIKFASKEIPKCPYLVQVTGKLGDPKKVIAQGPGIEPKGVQVNRKTYFEVITKGAGAGVVDVGIVDPNGKKETVKTTITKKSDDVWYVEYTALVVGMHSVNVNFGGKPIPKSPFGVAVSKEGGPQLDPAKLPKPVACTPREAALGSLATPLKAAPGSTARDPDEAPLTAAAAPGQQAAPGSLPLDAKKCWATGRGIQPKGIRVGEQAEFKVHTENAGNAEPKVLIIGPGGVVEKFTIKKVTTTFEYTYKPMKAGTYVITINFNGQGIPKSPFKVDVAALKQSKIKAYGPGLVSGVVGQPALFTVEPNGEAPIGFKIEGPSQAKIDVKKDPETGTMDVTYWPTAPGEYAVHVLCNNDDTPKSPYMADIKPATPGFDAGKVIASGPGLEKNGVVVNKQTEFTVDTRQAGQAPLEVTAFDVDGTPVNVTVTDNKNGTYLCRYTATRTVKHTITITYGSVSIPKSPFKVFVSTTGAPGGPAPAGNTPTSKVKVYGPAIEGPVKPLQSTYVIIDCKEAGAGMPQVTLTDARNMPVPFKILDKKDRTYHVEFTTTSVGVMTLNVSFASKPVPNSPFKIKVEAGAKQPAGAGPDPSKVKVSGPAIERPVQANSPTFVLIDCREAGPGEPMFSLLSDKGTPVQYKLINNNDRTYRAEFEISTAGTFNANVFFTGKPVPRSPFKVTVEAATPASKVKVYGPAIEQPVVAYQMTYLIVDCKEAGDGQPMASIVNDKGAQVPYKLIDNKDRTFKVEFQATVAGVHTVNIFFQNRPVPKSPFKIDVKPGAPSNVSGIVVRGLPETIPVNQETSFEIVTAPAGPGQVKATVTSPSGRNFPVIVEQKPDVAAARFTPTEAGPHSVAVTFNDQPVPNSPFKTIAQAPNPMRVKVYGPAVEHPVAPYQPTFLIVDCKEAGPGEPVVTLIDNTGKPVPMNVLDNKDRTYRVEFSAITAGTIFANVLYAKQPVPNSPFKVTVQAGVKVYGPAVEGPVLPQQTTYLVVDCKDAGPGQPQVSLMTEQGAPVPAKLTDNGDRTYRVEFQPNIASGTLVAAVNFNNQPVPSSPFKINVQSGVRVYGPAVEGPVLPQQTTFMVVDCKDVGPGVPQVSLMTEQGAPVPAKLTDNGDRTYRVEFQPNIASGTLVAAVNFNNQPVPSSPFKINVQPGVRVYGPAVEGPVQPQQSTYMVVDCKDVGPGVPQVSLMTEQGAPVPAKLTDNGDRTYRVEFQPNIASGTLVAAVNFNNQPVPSSPFKINVSSTGGDPTKVTVKDLPQQVPIGRPVPFNISTAGAGPGQAKVNVVSPSGRNTPAPVSPTPEGFISQLQADEPGPHNVHVTFNDQPVPNSPFKVDAVPEGQMPTGGDASKVKAYGAGLVGGTSGTPCDFTIDTRSAGPGALGLTIDGPTKAEIECFDKGAGLYEVRYWPTQPGEYTTNILYDEKPIPGSPFKAQVNPAQMVDVSGVKTYGPGVEPGVFLESVTDFTVDAKSVVPKGTGNVKAILTTPSGALTEAQIIDNKDGTFTGLYTPFEQGPHKIDVSYDGVKVPNSPFNVGVQPGCDPSKVKAYGPGLNGAQPNKPATFTISTRGAGQGGVGLSVVGPTEPKVGCVDNQDGTLTVEYLPDSFGDHEIGVTFANQPIPGSPFHVNVTDAPVVNVNAVKCFGPGLNPKGVRKGTPGVFTVDTTQAGEAELMIVATDLTHGQSVPVDVAPATKRGTYDVAYTPDFEGPCRLDVTYGGQPVPNSPFTSQIQPSTDLSKVFVSGDGVNPSENALASIPLSFVVDTRQAGHSQLDVEIIGPQGTPVKPSIQSVGDGTYFVSYVPEDVGQHKITVKYAGQEIPTGPFRVNTVPTGDASKVKVQTETIKQRLSVSEESVIRVRTEEAGFGNITCQVTSSATTEIIEATVTENNDGTVTIRYQPTMAGVYKLDLKFGGVAVPMGHIEQTVGTTRTSSEQLLQASQSQPQQFAAAPGSEPLLAAQTSQPQHAQAPQPIEGLEPAPQEGAPSPYHPCDFAVKIGPDFSQTDAVITTPSGKKHRPRIVDNHNGTIKVCYQPAEVGLHTLSVTYAGAPVPKSPFNFFVHEKKPGQVIAFGPGLTSGTAGQPTSFTVVTKDSGPGGLGLAIEGPSKAEIQCKDNKDGTATITYTPVTPGDYKIVIKFAGKLIEGAPFTAKVAPAEFVQEVRRQVTEETARTSNMTMSRSSVMSLTTTESDLTNLTAKIRTPSGQEEPCGLKRQPSGQLGISFTPRETGDHWVNVFRNGQPIPGSPFKIFISGTEIGNASKVKVTGQSLTTAMANEVNEFNINTKEAGVGALSLSVVGPGKVDIKCDENPDGTMRVSYKPTEPGQYHLTVKYADENVPGSPYTVNVGGQGSGRVTESIVRQSQAMQSTTSVGSTCELNIKMAGINARDIDGTVTSPSGTTDRCEVIDLGNNRFTIKFQPKEMGVHIVSLKTKGMHIPGSPFQFTVGPIAGGGAHKVHAIGSGLARGDVNKPCPFTIITREAGPGSLSLGIEGPSKATIDFQDKHDGTSDVTYVVTEPGEYMVSVKYNGEHIPDSPFKVYIAPSTGESQKLNVQNLQQQELPINTPTQFTVDFNGAQGSLDAKVVSPSGAENNANVQEIQPGKFAVNFVPTETGVHMVHVRLNGQHVPGSPYPVQVGRADADASKVTAYGEGLVKGSTGQLCKFIVNTVNAGSGALSIGISGPSKVELQCREVAEGYEFSYTPLAPGDYLITIKYAGQAQIPGSPFKARIDGPGRPAQFTEESRVVMETVTKTSTTTTQYSSMQQQQQMLQMQQVQQQQQQVQQLQGAPAAADASKVKAAGAGLQRATVNQEMMFSVDGSATGYNMLVMGIAGPQIPCEQLTIIHLGRLQYTVKYRLSQPGNYVLMVKWGDQHIPGSPFNIVAQ
jgi:filamin